ncbi:hypothetical protein EV702DRAFT_1204766 [Suillus placidus]|uniref:Uncharacterized protein n=1 Tax=Suillus placidus TaxID=48579 RepID=A0A9P6ZGH6_9AGAM|nr:hypothetical protein EV702DRAFT_1204766 [Suillus placidus]
MSNRRTPADVDQTHPANPSPGSSEQLQDNQPRPQRHSLSSSSSSASFHQSTSAPASTGDQQWFPDSQQMIVTSSSFYDPAQTSSFTALQPTMNAWDTQFTGPGGQYFPRQNPTYQQPYAFEGASTNQYSLAQDQVQQQQRPQQRPIIPAPRRSARGGARASGYYRQSGAQSQQHGQYSQVPPPAPSNQPPPTQPSQEPTGQALAAQRTTQLIAGQFSPVQPQQPQPHFSPPPTQSQFQIQQTQFPSTPQFTQNQSQARPQSQFSQPHHPHVPSQSHAHPHVPTQSQSHSHSHPHAQSHIQSQPQAHAPPNPPQQSQHYSGSSDPYYDMYYAMNSQGSQSAPSLVSVFLLVVVLGSFGKGSFERGWTVYVGIFYSHHASFLFKRGQHSYVRPLIYPSSLVQGTPARFEYTRLLWVLPL